MLCTLHSYVKCGKNKLTNDIKHELLFLCTKLQYDMKWKKIYQEKKNDDIAMFTIIIKAKPH